MGIKITRTLRILLVVFIAVYIGVTVKGATPSQTSFETMCKVIAKYQNKNTQLGNNQAVKRLYKLNPADYEGVLLYQPNSTMNAEEILVVKLKDKSQANDVKNAIEERKKTQLNTFKGYGAAQTDLLNKSIIDVQPNYILYVVDGKASVIDDAFRKALQEENIWHLIQLHSSFSSFQ